MAGADVGADFLGHPDVPQVDLGEGLADDPGLVQERELGVDQDDPPPFHPTKPTFPSQGELETLDPDLDPRFGGDRGELSDSLFR